MTENREVKSTEGSESAEFSQHVDRMAARKLRARRHATQTIWSGLGMMGMVGWSVAMPTVLGAALGLWLDKHHPGNHSWTLALLALGLGLGCVNAWYWVTKEDREIRKQEENGDE
jgi:ATP synthase protein I